jgi:hypothetical protein
VPYKFLCSMVHQWFVKYNNFRYCKFFCWYFAQFNDINFSRYFKLCFFILPLNFYLMMLCDVFILHPSFYGLLVLKFWWPQGLSIVMNVNCFHGEKKFLCKFVVSTLCLVPTKLKMLFYLFLNFENSLFLFLDFLKVWN